MTQAFAINCCCCQPLVLKSFTTDTGDGGQDCVDLTEFFTNPITNYGVENSCYTCLRWRLIEVGESATFAGYNNFSCDDQGCSTPVGGLVGSDFKLIPGYWDETAFPTCDYTSLQTCMNPVFTNSLDGALCIQDGSYFFCSQYTHTGFMELQIGCCDGQTGDPIWPD